MQPKFRQVFAVSGWSIHCKFEIGTETANVHRVTQPHCVFQRQRRPPHVDFAIGEQKVNAKQQQLKK